MTKYKLEYIWLDGKKPVPELRGKTTIKSFDKPPTLADLPNWGFDGSSTMQAEGKSSDCILKPVALYPDASRKDAYIVLSEVMHPDGTPHSTNMRATIENDPDLWIGFEQEYFLYQGWASARLPGRRPPQHSAGPVLLRRRLQIHGQRGPQDRRRTPGSSVSPPASITKASTRKSPRASGNSRSSPKAPPRPPTTLWTARYLMMRLCEKYEVDVVLHCKPIKGDWNGSGMHTNFSTKYMREVGGKEYFEALMKAFSKNVAAHIAVYGPDNHLRLTGLHETQAIDKFSYGLSDRGASIRMPVNFIKNGYKGYLEDRRPNSEGDPYQIVSRILKTINSVPKPVMA